jgi:FkbM family methyltransferase
MLNILSYPARSFMLPVDVKALYVKAVSRAWGALSKKSTIQGVPEIGLMNLNPFDVIGSRLFFYGTWEPVISEFVQKHLQQAQNAAAIDIGANIGYYTLMFSHLVGLRGTVYSIEPSPAIRQRLQQNIALNHLDNIKIVPYGISNQTEVRTFHLNTGRNLGFSHFGEASVQDEVGRSALELRRLTDVVPPEDLARTAIIKVDVEGMEYQVLTHLFDNIALFPQQLLILAELRIDEGGPMESLARDFTDKGFETYLLPNRYDHAFYAASTRVQPKRIQDLPYGQHDLAFLRK